MTSDSTDLEYGAQGTTTLTGRLILSTNSRVPGAILSDFENEYLTTRSAPINLARSGSVRVVGDVSNKPQRRGRPDLSLPRIGYRHGEICKMHPYEPAKDAALIAVTEGLAERLEGYIERMASGRIRDLHVSCSDDHIVLNGRSRTYHAKQIAQQAVFDLIEFPASLANMIVVG